MDRNERSEARVVLWLRQKFPEHLQKIVRESRLENRVELLLRDGRELGKMFPDLCRAPNGEARLCAAPNLSRSEIKNQGFRVKQ